MENLFSTKGVEEVVAGGNSQKYIYGGIYNDVKISNVVAGVSANKGTPQITVTMHTAEGGPEAARDFNFYFTENSAKMSMAKLKHIATKIVTNDEFEAINATSTTELAEGLASLLKGQRLRMKFTCEEYLNTAGEVKERANIGLPNFAEAIQDGAEYSPVSDASTELVYDKSNKLDFKKLPNTGPTDEASVGASQGSLSDI